MIRTHRNLILLLLLVVEVLPALTVLSSIKSYTTDSDLFSLVGCFFLHGFDLVCPPSLPPVLIVSPVFCCRPPSTRAPTLKLCSPCSLLSDHLLSMPTSRWYLRYMLYPYFSKLKSVFLDFVFAHSFSSLVSLSIPSLLLPWWSNYALPIAQSISAAASVKFATSLVFGDADANYISITDLLKTGKMLMYISGLLLIQLNHFFI